MISASVTDSGVARGLTDAALFLGTELPRGLHGLGEQLEGAVKRHAQGRPGPQRVTGAYVSSIGMQAHQAGVHYEVEVGTNAPEGRRLEYGFHKQDKLGRSFHQPPFPHWRPALAETMPAANALFERLLSGVQARLG